ncbi:MAG: nucleotidyltransferase domain-containing protein [Clostridia bacterium]|nr:nucleotidyltransferase domain-containing protein [Clostridia bacterium]
MEKRIEIIKETILNKMDCEAIILFGSYVRGTQNTESDIDIAIKPKEEISRKDIFYLAQNIEEKIKIDVDLINLDTIGDGFRYEILLNGKILYCKNELAFELYKLNMYREYLELNESRKIIMDEIMKGDSNIGK